MIRSHTTAVVCFVAVLCATAALPSVVGHETPPPCPQLEPNDEFDRATDITPRSLHGLSPIEFTSRGPGPEIDKPSGFRTIEDTDEDVYAVDLDRGDRLPVTLYHYGSDGNVRYTVYDPSKSEIERSDRPTREIETAYRRDDLRVDGIGTVNAVKWTVLNGAKDVIDRLPRW